jgi:hypothetical protein
MCHKGVCAEIETIIKAKPHPGREWVGNRRTKGTM